MLFMAMVGSVAQRIDVSVKGQYFELSSCCRDLAVRIKVYFVTVWPSSRAQSTQRLSAMLEEQAATLGKVSYLFPENTSMSILMSTVYMMLLAA